jgi:probable HAF family extracellular repeat protein
MTNRTQVGIMRLREATVTALVVGALVIGLGSGQSAAVRYSRIDLGTFGGTDSRAQGINALGDAVGFAQTTGNASSHAFLWRAALGLLDQAQQRG